MNPLCCSAGDSGCYWSRNNIATSCNFNTQFAMAGAVILNSQVAGVYNNIQGLLASLNSLKGVFVTCNSYKRKTGPKLALGTEVI